MYCYKKSTEGVRMSESLDPNYVGDDLSEEQDIYRENILDHYRHPHNKKRISPCDVQHKEHNPICGDQIEIFIRFEDKKVVEVGFDGHGCAISQASVSMLTDKIKRMTIDDINSIKREDILEMLGIPIGVVRQKCALLCLKAVQKGVQNLE